MRMMKFDNYTINQLTYDTRVCGRYAYCNIPMCGVSPDSGTIYSICYSICYLKCDYFLYIISDFINIYLIY